MGAIDDQYGSLSYWRASAGPFSERARPQARPKYDVAIVGAGFHGLWSAYHLLKADPALSVAILDQSHVGFGASGRNGGFATTKIGLRVEDLERKYGPEPVARAFTLMGGKIDELIDTLAKEKIECELDKGGVLLVATNKSQERRVMRELKSAQRIGIPGIVGLSGEEVRQRINAPSYLCGRYDPACAVLHPFKLARGLAETVERMGAQIFENVRFKDADFSGDNARVITDAGAFVADKVVMTINAWAGHDKRFRNTVVPTYVYVLATEPLSEAVWSDIGWQGREGVEDTRLHINFYRRTRDNRIVFGGSDNVIPFLGEIHKRHDANERCFERLRQSVIATFPQLAQTRFEYRWGGVLAMTPDFNPRYGAMHGDRLVYGHGCCGHGVGLSFLGGEIMRDLVLARPSQAEDLFFMPPSSAAFPMEPLRSIGGALTLAEARWFDDAQDKGQASSEEPWLLRMAPKWFG